ncbi:MAG TPA: hypothetical protein VFV63_13775, partial [Ilumatobacteraceae bacterium]|nr:hypothetical protein [Ilumatobacteraceae bacterium]
MHAGRSAAALFGTLVGVMGVGTMVVGGMGFVALPSAAAAPPDAGAVLLSDVGSGFTLANEVANTTGPDSLTRRFEHENALLDLTVIPVTTPPGVRDLFGIFTSAAGDGFESVPEPSLDLAGWLVAPGSQVGDKGDASLVFASRDHLFVFALFTDESAGIDAPGFVRQLAQRQVEVAGGPPTPIDPSRDRGGDDELVALLPANPPAEYGLTSSATVTGTDELPVEDELKREVVDFLNNNSATATRVWSDPEGELL